jgi:hypothetical protein
MELYRSLRDEYDSLDFHKNELLSQVASLEKKQLEIKIQLGD